MLHLLVFRGASEDEVDDLRTSVELLYASEEASLAVPYAVEYFSVELRGYLTSFSPEYTAEYPRRYQADFEEFLRDFFELLPRIESPWVLCTNTPMEVTQIPLSPGCSEPFLVRALFDSDLLLATKQVLADLKLEEGRIEC